MFTIPLGHCGTEVATKRSQIGSAENVMIVQLDPLVQVNMNSQPSPVCQSLNSPLKSPDAQMSDLNAQKDKETARPAHVMFQEVWDSARRISCTWEDSYHKAIR